jgi:hypothetical protein
MRVRTSLLIGVLTAGSMISACARLDTVTAPPSVRPEQPAPPVLPPFDGSCVAAEARWAIGERASTDLLERARVAAQAAVARFLRPNQPITTEYLGSRLNLHLDERDVVRAVSCG